MFILEFSVAKQCLAHRRYVVNAFLEEKNKRNKRLVMSLFLPLTPSPQDNRDNPDSSGEWSLCSSYCLIR